VHCCVVGGGYDLEFCCVEVIEVVCVSVSECGCLGWS
jgi:hypothetical protein